MKNVNKPFRKKDAMQLVTGKPVYMDDLAPADCLIVKLLRSPHPNAIVKTINTTVAKKVPGIEAIFTWEDVDQNARRYTQAGQTYPEASPYDRLVIDRHVRFVGLMTRIMDLGMWSALATLRRVWKTIWVELRMFRRP